MRELEDDCWPTEDRVYEEKFDLPVAPGQDPYDAAAKLLNNLNRHCPTHPQESIKMRFHGVREEWSSVAQSGDSADTRLGAPSRYVLVASPGNCVVCATNRTVAGYGVPKLFHEASFENFVADNDELQRNLSTCQKYAARPRGFLVMLGKAGAGKTHLAAAVLRAARPRLGRYFRHLDIVETMRESYRAGNYTHTPTIRHVCRRAGLLVIDEIGLSKSGNDADVLLHDILDYRYAEMKPTVLCANIPTEEIEECLGERLVDRFRQALFGGQILNFNSPSRRPTFNAAYMEK